MKKIVGFVLFILMTSCEKEDIHYKREDANVVRNVKLSDLTILQNTLQNGMLRNNMRYRDTINYFDLIDENNITVITRSNGDKTYTFSLKIAEVDKLTNLVVRESGSEYEFDLIEYLSDDLEQWKVDIRNKNSSSIKTTIKVVSLSGGAICIDEGYVCPSGLHRYGQENICEYSFGEWSYFLMQVPCSLDEGGNGGGGNSNGGGTTPTIEEPEPYTEPVFPELTSAIADFIASQPEWNNLAPQIKTQIVNYLLQNIKNNTIKPQAEEFAQWAADCLSETFYDNTFEELLKISNLEEGYRSRMSTSELNIFDSLTWKQQYYYLLSAKNASDKAEELFPTTLHNGKGDAYRHALWNALSTKRIGSVLTENLTDAHENRVSGYPFEFKEIQMDLYNNLIGRQIANGNPSEKFWEIIKNSLENGDLMELSPLGLEINGTYYVTFANPNSILISTN